MRKVDLTNDFEALDGAPLNGAFSQAASAGLGPKRRAANSIFWLKYVIDASLALVALLVLLPMVVTICAILLISQGGPILIAHRRIGKNGVLFPCYKFRTMVKNGDEVLERHLTAHPEMRREWNESRKLKVDPRVTYFGQSLRRNSLDEIPQLLNVIRGEMSLVGPRPITQSEVEFYGPHFADYVAVRPGLTGLWQVSGRSETSYEQRVQFDVRYVAERTLIGDFVIMAKTIPAVISSRGSY